MNDTHPMEYINDFISSYSYFGARYYDPNISIWLSVDPLSDKYPGLSPFAYCTNNPIRFIDPDGRDWAEVETGSGKDKKTEIQWFKNKEAFEKSGQNGTYLGEAVVIFSGSNDEKLGNDGTLTGEGANPASVTIYGVNGPDDIGTYDGLTMTSDPNEYTPIEEGDYKAFYQDMSSSPYGSKGGSLSYRIAKLNGDLTLSTKDGLPNIDKKSDNYGKPIKTDIFFHRTNNNGGARYSSSGCPVIDGRQWSRVEKHLGKSSNIFFRIER